MASLVGIGFLVSVMLSAVTAKPAQSPTARMDLRMPGVQPQIADTYLCYPTKVEDDALYITGFQPRANSSTAHHMLLYGCESPGEMDKVWNCGEMAMQNPKYAMGPVCEEGAQIVYAWAMDAPDLSMPKGVAFKTGASTNIKWMVLQVHYKDVSNFIPPANDRDHSGITLETTLVPQPKRAGVYLLGTGGEIPAHSTVYLETACSIDEPAVLHPFAFRVHAHSHGQVVSGYRVRDGDWMEIGRMSPQKPQMFYNVTNPNMVVHTGDVLAARCTMVNNENHTIDVGSTQKDEMCNFYVMYWVTGQAALPEEYCFSDGPPHWYWENMEEIHAENAPTNASVVPGTEEVLEASEKLMQEAEEQMALDTDELERELLEWLSRYDQQTFDNYMYNLLFSPQQPDYYPEAGLEDYYSNNQAPGYYRDSQPQGEGQGVQQGMDQVEDRGEDQAVDPQEMQELYPLSEEELRQYYQQQYGGQ